MIFSHILKEERLGMAANWQNAARKCHSNLACRDDISNQRSHDVVRAIEGEHRIVQILVLLMLPFWLFAI